MHTYEVRPRTDHRGVDLISDALPFGRLWYGEPNAVSNAMATRCTAADHGAVSTTAKYVNFVIDLRLRSSL